MRAKAATGELLDPGGDSFDLDAMQHWGKERTVSAAVLRDLLVGGPWPPVHAKGVRLRGVRISGLLDLEGATLRCPLSLDSCYFDEAVCLDHVTASRVMLTGCQLAGLTASMLTARQIDLSRSTLRTGPLLLMCADITGDLICSGAQLNGTDSDHNALVAGGIKVGGSVYLDQLDRPFTATGAVWLARADITGDLACSGAQTKELPRQSGTTSTSESSTLPCDENSDGIKTPVTFSGPKSILIVIDDGVIEIPPNYILFD
jgi:hypothetical protein